EITKWWSNVPDANLAVATGAVTGFWVLDVDGQEGIKALADLERQHGQLPRTPTARSGGGGLHHYFRWPKDCIIASKVRVAGLPLDVRGKDLAIVVPPSIHVSGKRYVWELFPDDAELADAPEWLLKLVTGKANGLVLPTAAEHAAGGGLADG